MAPQRIVPFGSADSHCAVPVGGARHEAEQPLAAPAIRSLGKAPGDRREERGRGVHEARDVGPHQPRSGEQVLLGVLARLVALLQRDREGDHGRRRKRHEHEQEDAAAESKSHGCGAVSLRKRRFASKLIRLMRVNRLMLPLAALFLLVPAAPAAAFDWKTNVVDFEFQPSERIIAVGDSVTWNFSIDGHTTASVGRQPDSWRSVGDGVNPVGTSYTHVFNTPGRFQYVCLQHRTS